MFINEKLDIDTQEITDKVLKLKDYWLIRSFFPFYTFGRNAYIDGPTPEYCDGIKETNPILLENFGELYDVVIKYLSNSLKEDVALDNTLAYPAFHIIKSHLYFLVNGGSWHQDRPHVTMGLGEEDPGSFTVAIKLPSCGAGMDYLDEEGVKHFPYEEGGIVVHSGFIPHRLAPIKKHVEGDYRITLQGHIIRKDGKLIIYW